MSKPEKEDFKLYRTHAPYYRLGALYPAGTVVRVKPSEKSKHWTEVDSQGRPVNPIPEPEVAYSPPEPEDISVDVPPAPEPLKVEQPAPIAPPAPPAPMKGPDLFSKKSKRDSDKDAI